MQAFKLRDAITNCIDVDADSRFGFNFPFKLIIPVNLSTNPELVYACNLPGDKSSSCSSFEDLIEYAKNDFESIDPVLVYLCLEKGWPMLVPAIPRFKGFRPNFLGRDCFNNDFSRISNSKFSNYLYMYENLANQHKKMMECGIKILRDNGIDVDDKVIVSGYSEGAKFASHLALLHPEMIKALIAGGTGGAISMPVAEIDGYEFTYPTGISDVDDFNYDDFSNISFFYYMGDTDKSDSAIPSFRPYYYKDSAGKASVLTDECGNETPFIDDSGKQVFILDKDGNYTAKFGLFSNQEVNSINKVLGTVIQDRFKKQEQIYNSMGLKSIFKLYPGNHITVFNNRDEIFKDIDIFYEKYLGNHTTRKIN